MKRSWTKTSGVLLAGGGASDDPEKIGGRPLRYMREFGYAGLVVPVNPRREQVQGMSRRQLLRTSLGAIILFKFSANKRG